MQVNQIILCAYNKGSYLDTEIMPARTSYINKFVD